MQSFHKKSHRLFMALAGVGSLLVILFLTTIYISLSFILSNIGEIVSKQANVLCGCQALSGNINYPLFGFVSLVAITLLTVLLISISKTILTIMKTKKFLSSQKTRMTDPSAKLLSISKSLGIENRTVEITSTQPIIFCHGIQETKICISSAVIEQLDDTELRAVLLHEMYHAISGEPKKILFIQFLRGFAWVPGIRKLIKKYISASEIAADELATNNFTAKHSLASAMAKILEMEEKNYVQKELAVPYFSQMTEERISVLTDASYQPKLVNEFLKTGLSVVGGILVLFFLSSTVQRQEVRAQEAYTRSGCANKILIEQCENRWTNCAGQAFHQKKIICNKGDKSYLQD